jgi:hypothetical protein
MDDKPEALQSVQSTCKICFGDYSWNRDYKGFKVNSWLGFKAFVDKIQKLDIK